MGGVNITPVCPSFVIIIDKGFSIRIEITYYIMKSIACLSFLEKFNFVILFIFNELFQNGKIMFLY